MLLLLLLLLLLQTEEKSIPLSFIYAIFKNLLLLGLIKNEL
jgi:hypothetical protein